MQYPTINNSLCFDNIDLGMTSSLSSADFGVVAPRHEPMREVDLPTSAILKLFERKEALYMIYIPHFVTQCIMYYLDMLLQYASENKMSEFKKHSRALRAMKKDYQDALRKEMPSHVYGKFLEQKDEFLGMCAYNLQIMYFTFANELSKKFGHHDDEPAFCYASIIYALADCIDEHDRKTNKEIARRLGMPTRNYPDERINVIKRVCEDIIKPYPIDKHEQTDLAVGIIVTKAKTMINNMLNEN